MATLKPIRSEEEYDAVLARIHELWNAPVGSAEHDEMEALAILVEAYEQEAHPIPPPHPIDALLFAMEQRGMKRKDLEGILGSSGRVSEVMQCKRPLTLAMIRRIHDRVGVSPNILIRKYKLKRSGPRKKEPSRRGDTHARKGSSAKGAPVRGRTNREA